MQNTVVELVQKAEDPSMVVGEGELFDKLRHFLRGKGLGELAMDRAISTLHLESTDMDDNVSVSTVGADVEALTEMSEPEYAKSVGSVDWPDLGEPPQAEDCRLQVTEEEAIDDGWFVVSAHKRSGFRRLHKKGKCRLQPFQDYPVHKISEAEPAASEYDAKCKMCFRAREVVGNSSSDCESVSS
jgi:hypothetical protein